MSAPHLRGWGVAAVCLVAIAIGWAESTPNAQGGGSRQQPAAPRMVRVAAGQSPDPLSRQTLDGWKREAAAQGRVRLIVTLRTADSSPGAALAPAVQNERAAARQRVLGRLGRSVRFARGFDAFPIVALHVDAAGVDALALDPDVAVIADDQVRGLSLSQSVPLVQGDQMWASGYTGAGQTVAILDTGVDKTHSAFGGRVVSEACYSGGGSTSQSLCPGQVLSSTAPGSAMPCPTCNHGTHVAGIAAGSTGVAKEASIIAIQVFSSVSGGLSAYDSDLLNGLQRVLDLRNTYNIVALNLSLGGGLYSDYCDSSEPSYAYAFSVLRAYNIAAVVASGNDGKTTSMSAPACVSAAVSVGSVTKSDVVASYSNTPWFMTLFAPGSSITAPIPGNSWGTMSGTSMATPHVTGAWALLRQLSTSASVSAISSALRSTGLSITASNGLSFPRIRIMSAATLMTTFTVSPITWNAPGEAASQVFTVTASSPDAIWTASSNQSWLTVSAPGGTGSGSVTLTAAANPSSVNSRTATVTIAGWIVDVTQAAGTASFTLSPTSWAPAAAGGTQGVTVTASHTDAAWTASSNRSWLTLSPSSGTGSGSVTLTAAATTSGRTRSATVTIGGQTVAVTQAAGVNTITLSPTTWSTGASGGTKRITVTSTYADATWMTSSDQDWLTLSAVSGTGSGSVTLTAAATTSANARTATATIGGQTVAVTQAAGTNSITLSPTTWSAPANGGTTAITVTSTYADGAWTASSNQTWLTLDAASGAGSSTVTLMATANPSSVSSRTATATIGGKSVSVTQAAGTASVALTPVSWNVPAAGGTQDVTVTASHTDAAWTASSNQAWLTLSTAGGTGSGTVTLTAAATTSATTRAATVTIGGQAVAVTQAAATLVANGTFDLDASNWSTYGPTSADIVYQIANGVLEWYRPSGSASGVVLQDTGQALDSGVVIEAAFDLGNSTSVRKRASILLHNSDFADLSVCTFTLEPGAPLRTYRMRTHTTQAWTNASISVYAADTGHEGDGYYRLDNVSLQVVESPSAGAAQRTECVDPTAPISPGGATSANLIVNGTFTGGASGWTTYGNLAYQATGDELQFYKQPGTPSGVVLQSTAQTLDAGQPVTATMQLGNSSATRQRVTVLIHDGNFSDILACTWWLAPNAPLGSYAMRVASTKAWSNATLSIYPASAGSTSAYEWLRLDNVTMALTAEVPLGTECFEPGSAQPAPAASPSGVSGSAMSTLGASGTSAMAAPAPLSSDASAARSAVLLPAASSPELLPVASASTAVAGWGATSGWVATTDLSSTASESMWSIAASGVGVETLTRTDAIDLRDASDARLQFRSWLASRASTAVVQVSVDGIAWMTSAVLPAANDWTSADVSLSAYLGQRVWVRFVFTAAHGVPGEMSDTWVIGRVKVLSARLPARTLKQGNNTHK